MTRKDITMTAMSILLAACGGSELGPEAPEPEEWEEVQGPAGEPLLDDMDTADGYETLETSGETDPPTETGMDETSLPDEETVTDSPLGDADEVYVTSAMDDPEPDPAAPTEEEPSPPQTIEGKILSRKGKKVVVAVEGSTPEAGSKATLLKYFEQEMFGFMTTGWLDIASVEVKQVAGTKVHLLILEEHSEATINGKKVNHFKKGNRVKIEME